MKFICKVKNFWNGRLWRPGDTVEISQQDASASSLVSHFRPAEQIPPPVSADEDLPGEGDAVPPASVEDEASTMRGNLKTLCLRNGIDVKPRMSLKAMREALATRGITVN